MPPDLNKREYFAILALQGLIGVENDPLTRVLAKSIQNEPGSHSPETAAMIKVQAAVLYADTLINELSKQQ